MSKPSESEGRANPMWAATDFIRTVASSPERFPERFIDLPMDPDLILRILSRERTRLMQYLNDHGPVESVHALAEALDRNYASVSRDLGVLGEIGLVETHREGKNKSIRSTRLPILIQ